MHDQCYMLLVSYPYGKTLFLEANILQTDSIFWLDVCFLSSLDLILTFQSKPLVTLSLEDLEFVYSSLLSLKHFLTRVSGRQTKPNPSPNSENKLKIKGKLCSFIPNLLRYFEFGP